MILRVAVFHICARIPVVLGKIKGFVAKLVKMIWKNIISHSWLALEHVILESRCEILWKQISLNFIENYWFSWSEVNEVCLSFSFPALGRIMKLPEDTDHSIKIIRWFKHIRVDFWYPINFLCILVSWAFEEVCEGMVFETHGIYQFVFCIYELLMPYW